MDTFIELLPTIIPSVIAILLALIAFVLKMKSDNMKGMSKELSELVLSIIEAAKDGNFTTEELKEIITEAQDVIEEAKKLLAT